MPWTHIVDDGEHLAKIAADFGIRDYRTIWNHPENASLKEKRKNPNVLHPGDRLYIPDREARTESAQTEKRHRFVLLRGKLLLNIKVRDVNNRPVVNTPCDLYVEGAHYRLTTNSAGMVQQEIENTARTGRLVVNNPDVPIDLDLPLLIGSLDPSEEESGQRARLANLGYEPGEGGPETDAFRSAVQEFQCDNNLRPVTGVCDGGRRPS